MRQVNVGEHDGRALLGRGNFFPQCCERRPVKRSPNRHGKALRVEARSELGSGAADDARAETVLVAHHRLRRIF